MTILDAGDITPKQASALFDVALGEFPFFAECAQAVAYNHSGIISPVRLEGKQRTCLPSPSIWALSRSIHATTSFDAAVAVPGEIYSMAMNSLPHRN